MIYDICSNSFRNNFTDNQEEDIRDEFTLGFKQGHYSEKRENKIKSFSAPKSSFPDYELIGEDEHRLEKTDQSIQTQTIETNCVEACSEEGSKYNRDLDSEHKNLTGNSFDTKKVRNKWIDAVETLLDLAGYGKAQLNSRKRFNEETAKHYKEPKKWMLLPKI